MSSPSTATPEPHRYGQMGPAICALRFAGADFRTIAQQVGVGSPAEAQRIYLDELSHTITGDDRDTMRTEAAAQLRSLLTSVWSKAHDQDNPEHLFAVQRAQGIIDRMIKLHGLDAPQEVVVHTPTTAEIDNWVRAVVGEATTAGVVEADIVDVTPPPAIEGTDAA